MPFLFVKTSLACTTALGLLALVAPANAADLNWVELFRSQAIKCMHKTVDPEKAVIEVIKAPTTVGDITTVRVKAYYDGLMKKNVMEAEVIVRQAGSIRQMKINPLSDTGTTLVHCDMERTWRDF